MLSLCIHHGMSKFYTDGRLWPVASLNMSLKSDLVLRKKAGMATLGVQCMSIAVFTTYGDTKINMQ